ncbi:MAG: Trk system potassium transporter TrkA [Clostridiales bacterium]|nr:Trk system potassium transporter TrkA [Clostridiales bacterium]
MNIIIAGDGKVGSSLARQLSQEGHSLTLIDSNQKVLETSIEKYDVMAVQGNCASMAVLKQAGAEDADLLIAVTNADEVNLLCCMTAHGINPKLHTIARIRNPEYIDQIYEMRDFFALSLAVNPDRQAAVEIERLLRLPGFMKREPFAKGRVEIVELKVDARSKLKNVTLSELNGIVKCKVLVCTVLRDGKAIAPGGDFILRENDRIFVTAPTDDLAALLKNLGIITRKVNRVILCGGGRISYYLSQQLQHSGISVQLIEQDEERCVQLAGVLPHTCIVHGDASSESLLESEHIDDCDALVTLTGIDEMNMVISIYGKNRGVPHVITKIGHLETSSILNSLPLGSVISPKDICCNTIVRYVRAMRNQTGAAVSVHTIADGQVEAVEFLVDDNTLHCGEPLRSIKLRKNVLIASISHGARTEIPNGSSTFNKGDSIIIVFSGDGVINQLNEIFE